MADINGIPYVESSDLVSAYPAVSQSLAQEVSDQLASKVDYALPVNAQTGTTYTFVAADAEKLTTASNAAAVTLTIPPQSSVTWSNNTVLRVVNYGAGAVTIDGGSGVTVTNTSSTIAQYGAAVAIRTGSDAWTVVPFGGGDVPAAEVSSPAATGQYTDGGGQTWDYYTFTSSGTLTVDTAGFADVLVVGGGGGGASRNGGGGAGGHLYVTDAYLPAGALTVTVGAGGAGGGSPASNTALAGNNGLASRIASYYSPGGAGGGSITFQFGTSNYYSGPGLNGGSGSGGAGAPTSSLAAPGGSGTAGLGNNGGSGWTGGEAGGGGGGAGAAGGNASGSTTAGAGGAGLANSITGTSVTRAGGGGGGNTGGGGAGGTGGGGAGGGNAGTANTGGGGGGNYSTGAGGNGGSGIVIVRVKV